MERLLSPDERLVQHRGISSPICPNAELTRAMANQNPISHIIEVTGLCIAVIQDDQIRLKYLGETPLAIKTVGEPNAVIDDRALSFYGWWCHTLKVDGVSFALVGRPNKRHYLGARYTVPVPTHVSTNTWNEALEQLPDFAQAYLPDVRAARAPRVAVHFDNSRSALDDAPSERFYNK